MDVLVVGAGSMGRWLGRILHGRDVPDTVTERGRDDGCTVVYYDQHGPTAERAAEETGGRAVTTPAAEYDAVCIAVPIPAATKAIAAHADRATLAAFDITGTMSGPVEALARHSPDVERCSFHPLFSPDNEPGNVPVVVGRDGPVTAFVRDSLLARGNAVFETTPAEHDEAMETVQARAHAAVLAYGLAGTSVPDRFQTTVSNDLSDLLGQVAGGEARVYADIQDAFDGAGDVADAAARLEATDREGFEELYRQIQEGRTEQ